MKSDFGDESLSPLFDSIPYVFGQVEKTIENNALNMLLVSANDKECLINIPNVADYHISQDKLTISPKTNKKSMFKYISTFADVYALPAYLYTNKRFLLGCGPQKLKVRSVKLQKYGLVLQKFLKP